MTASERTAWYGDAAKGAYNYTDLNRVESAVEELSWMLGLSLETKTDWTLWDVPTAREMNRYLNNVAAIRDACPVSVTFPALPGSMSGLTYDGANRIEKVLHLVYENLGSIEHRCVLGQFVLGECELGADHTATDSTVRSGDIYCGEVL
jgi:hypothetical protein